jgi:hypothetical protein
MRETRMAAPISAVANIGEETAGKVSAYEQKNFATSWKRIGKIQKHGDGLKLDFQDPAGASHIAYVTRQALYQILQMRAAGDVITITETANEVITTISGRAFRSRTGRALCIRTPYYAGADMMVPWKMLERVINNAVAVAPVSIVQNIITPPKPRQNPTTALSHGLEGAF